ncbi:MAG TPA: hypothetical protein VMG10_35375 [Gemmataceae bacterium]|nr:hypothetical protein [Gemmataceae bacterium]
MKDDGPSRTALLAKAIAVLCVRNTFLEDLHSGITPSSRSGDYSDVKVVTPYGEIPWRELSRLSDAEMKRLMKEIVDKIYTFLCRQAEPEFQDTFLWLGNLYASRWDEPRLEEGFVLPGKRPRKKPRKGGAR